MYKIAATAGLLILSNIFMTFAWYGHLKGLREKTDTSWTGLALAILMSWGIAFFEYLIQVPANRLGFSAEKGAAGLSLMQLKVMQEIITLCVFVPFVIFYMNERNLPWLDFLLAGLCLVGAVYFVFRSGIG